MIPDSPLRKDGGQDSYVDLEGTIPEYVPSVLE
jgi:hypothetical protein